MLKKEYDDQLIFKKIEFKCPEIANLKDKNHPDYRLNNAFMDSGYYEGQTLNEKRHGYGVMYYSYPQEFKSSKYYSTYSQYDDCVKFEGQWQDGKKNGYGILELVSKPRYYKNEYTEDLEKEEADKLVLPLIYEGNWENNRLRGQGSLTYGPYRNWHDKIIADWNNKNMIEDGEQKEFEYIDGIFINFDKKTYKLLLRGIPFMERFNKENEIKQKYIKHIPDDFEEDMFLDTHAFM